MTFRTLLRFIVNMMMGEREEEPEAPPGPVALPWPGSTVDAQPAVSPTEMETVEPMVAFGGVAITKEEREEGKT